MPKIKLSELIRRLQAIRNDYKEFNNKEEPIIWNIELDGIDNIESIDLCSFIEKKGSTTRTRQTSTFFLDEYEN